MRVDVVAGQGPVMIPVTHRNGQTLYVFGLGKTGLSAVAALAAGGATVFAWDDRETSRSAAAASGAELASPEALDWSALDALVLSPGVPLTHPEPHPVVIRARDADIPVIGDTELFVTEVRSKFPAAKIVAITGTNGKSTTTALIGHLLSSVGQETEVGGNIGSHAVLELKPAINQCRYVIEFSSYQIDLTPSLRPDVAVFLNLSPDHLDRHGDFETYGAVKAKIFAAQGVGDTLVLGDDDPATAAMAGQVPEGVRLIRISQDHATEGGVFANGTLLLDATLGEATEFADLDGIGSLRGAHNRQNAAAAAAACMALGMDRSGIARGLRKFAGLAHRMEEIGRLDNVLLINDSKATNAEAAEKALLSFSDIYWIAGGLPKEGGIASLRPHFDRIARAYLIGEAADDFAETLGDAVPHEIVGTLDMAVAHAVADARYSGRKAPVVLLSPACASFDQFPNFEARGEAFRKIIGVLLAAEDRQRAPS